jgi:pyridoxine kinase
MPVLAAMGLQPCPLPTAALSTHTGGYSGIAVADLTDFMGSCVRHWKSLGLRFDAVYSGYLNSARQAGIVDDFITWQRSAGSPLVVVDPVMGDDGALYSSMPADMPAAMRGLCRCADLITPNMTEAALLTETEYSLRPRGQMEIYNALRALSELGAGMSMITSVPTEGGQWANVLYRRDERGYYACEFERAHIDYPGTGDLFASVMTGALASGETIEDALGLATGFVRHVVNESIVAGGETRAGVRFERHLNMLINRKGGLPVRFVNT